MRQGYVSVEGGFRIGFCGTGVIKAGEICNVKDFSSAVIRIARERKGIADNICPQLVDNGRVVSTLIVSPPAGGKTTLLRDMVRQFSNGISEIQPQRITLVDARGEVAAVHFGVPQLDVGRHTDVLDGYPKEQGMMIGVRTMNPQILAVDEITNPLDLEAMVQGAYCGVSLFATVHGTTMAELAHNPYIEVCWRVVFQRVVTISCGNSGRIYKVEVMA
ncbi:stage III sporulation protein AA [Bengtsoniella intestinalis]|uniref:stage III sporulation protein AA n=1 Tax=Bengtsoniella intestinalis TaxID=3073143 RepID=UPI00391F03F5